jgi:hypothetical protein
MFQERFINGERVLAHGGDELSAWSAQLVLVPDHNLGFFVATNTFDDQFREDLIAAIFDRYFPPEADDEPAFVDLEPSELDRFAGTYRWTRFSRSQLDKLVALFPAYTAFVDAQGDGTLKVSFLGIEEKWRYRPIGPSTFQKVSGDRDVVNGLVVDPGETISFSEDDKGSVAYLHLSLQNIAAERTSLFFSGIGQGAIVLGLIGLLILSLLVWGVAALVRRLRHREPNSRNAKLAIGAVVAMAALNVLGAVVMLLFGLGDDLAISIPPAVIVATTMILVAAILTAAAAPLAVAAWAKNWYTVGGRIYYTLVTVTGVAFVVWAWYWNVLGFKF